MTLAQAFAIRRMGQLSSLAVQQIEASLKVALELP